jgi:hypothetical protein
MTDQTVEPAVRFHVTETRNGATRIINPLGYLGSEQAVEDATWMNRDETGMARDEIRDIEVVYGVVRATTTYEPLDPDQES